MAKTKSKRKKRSAAAQGWAWLTTRPKLFGLLILISICLLYIPLHAYRNYEQQRKFTQARTAIDLVYNDVAQNLGQPDNLERSNNCLKASGGLHSSTICTVQTNFIYGLQSRDQANVLLKAVQQEIAASKMFKPSAKLSTSISDSLVFDSVYHDALDRYWGPHHISCSVKYSFDTPNEVDLSVPSHTKPLEIFFACSGSASRALYPLKFLTE